MPVTSTARSELEAAFEAFNGGDPEPQIAMYATEDVLLVGTDAEEWHESPETLAEALRAEGGLVTADHDLRELPAGPDAALVVGRMVFAMPDGTAIAARATYALRRDEGAWRIAHTHLSAPRGG